MNKDLYIELLNYFYKEYVYSLLGKTKKEIGSIDISAVNTYNVENKDDYIPTDDFYIQIPDIIKNGNEKNLIKSITMVFYEVITNNMNLFINKNDYHKLDSNYKNSVYVTNLFEYSIQKGICEWVSGDSGQGIEKLLQELDDWSKKTYEGHKVCFGFVIDFDNSSEYENSKYSNDFLHFLKDDYSAVLSDGFSSLINLNKNCDFIGFESLTKDDVIEECNISKYVLPYRFVQIISRYAVGNKIIITLLQNGDIILSKNQEIKFIKRNGKWLNFSINAFKSSINANIINNKKITVDLNRIYSTCIDVSLAHTGGIIAVVESKDSISKIVNRIDKINNKNEEDLFFEEFKDKFKAIKNLNYSLIDQFIQSKDKKELDAFIEQSEYKAELSNIKTDIINRLTKHKYIQKIIGKKPNIRDIDRKVLAELIGLDGACILDYEGNIIAVGAIIENDSGATGGGRGAAAKKLSKYGGFSIKISTDGYIEIYVEYNKIYSIK